MCEIGPKVGNRTCPDLPRPVQEDKYLLQTSGNIFISSDFSKLYFPSFSNKLCHILCTVAVIVSLPWAKHGRNWHEYKTEIGNLWSCGPRMARSLCRASSDMLYLNTLGSQLFLCHKCQTFLCLILFAAFGQLEFGWFLLLLSS